MSLRTYSLIVHPAFVSFVSAAKKLDAPLEQLRGPAPNVERPKLESVVDIADYLGITQEHCWSVLATPQTNYRRFTLTKRSGGDRVISAPRTYLKVMQWWVLDTILSTIDVSPFAYGFVRGRSFVDNAKLHHGAKHILNVDMKDFFPSISPAQVRSLFEEIGYRGEVGRELATLCTFEGELPQGAPTSPAIANLVFRPYDEALAAVAQALGMTYSRYADDLTFSSSERISPLLVEEIQQLLAPCFRLNAKKTRFMGPNEQKEVTGLILGKDGVCLSRDTLNRTRGWFHKLEHAESAGFEQLKRVQGTVALLRMVGGRGSGSLIEQGRRILEAGGMGPKTHIPTAAPS